MKAVISRALRRTHFWTAVGLLLALLALLVPHPPGLAATTADAPDAALLSANDRQEMASFERKAVLAKRLGATHVPISDGLPPAVWQLQPANDPYPNWYIQRPDFLKLLPPPELAPFVDQKYARRVMQILEERCKVLRRLGLKAHWGSNIPQVLPEGFFRAYPELRGPRVDQPNRSRTARFSASVDQPQVQRMYANALKGLLTRLPEIESFSFLTQDSGSGFCWLPSLYPGPNGNNAFKHRPVSDRVAGFLIVLKSAAKDVGREIEISLDPVTPRQWMIPSFSPEELDAIVLKLPRGVSIQGREGPDGRRFQRIGSSDAYARGAFYPVVGLAVPDLQWLQAGRAPAASADSSPSTGRRLIRLRADEATIEFEARLFEATRPSRAGSVVDRLASLRAFAVNEVGESSADDLLETWLAIEDAHTRLDALHFGDMLQFGHLLGRWINRPMVPFPEALLAAEKADYRPFLFQAKGPEQADNLIDIQGMRMYEGYGAHLLFQRVIETVIPRVEAARKRILQIRDRAADTHRRARWESYARRLETVIILLNTADNMVRYQAVLDHIRQRGVAAEANPVLGTLNGWDRAALMETARKEIDNTAHLLRLLEESKEPLLDLASVAEEETVMRLGPDLAKQLRHKLDVMNAHWMDYDRLATAPNP